MAVGKSVILSLVTWSCILPKYLCASASVLQVLGTQTFPLSFVINLNNSKPILHRISVYLDGEGALKMGLGISGCTKLDQELAFCSGCF